GDLSEKPGWVRLSLHPTMMNEELHVIINALKQIQANHEEWSKDYTYNIHSNEFKHKDEIPDKTELVKDWFTVK
ncbi:MAG: hypothetical protein J7L96_09140, partial [Bacteroidales bacterium]|nr:hypothetical protein [Bacteroidales bacterium]